VAVLIIDDGTASPLTIVVQSAGEGAPAEIGTVTSSFNGADRSSVRGVKRNFGALSTFVSTATKDAIISKLKSGRQIACSGDLLANIRTMTTLRYTGCTMSPSLVDFWTVGLALSEVQPSTPLLRFSPGDTITGEAFTRSTIGYQINAAGTLVSKAINVKRDGHFIGGAQSLLLEDTRANLLASPSDFSNAAWVKTTMTVGTGIADPTGGTAACTLTASAGNATAVQTLSAGTSRARANAVWLRRRTGTGAINVLKADGSVYVAQTLTGTWQRFPVAAAAASTARVAGIQIVTNGDAVDAYDYDLEDFSFVTSDPPGTRGADFYSMPFTTPPGEMTVYVKFVELGSILSLGNARAWEICDAPGNSPNLRCALPGANYAVTHDNATVAVTSTLAVNPVVGDVVELMCRLFGDGSVDITQSINGAASTSGAQSAANTLSTAWSGALFWPNSAGTAAGFNGYGAYQSVKVVAGVRSLAEMRAL
jgi:hypothetical protein